jgi:RNA polymerase sigma-70 factor (ECF subfamily)
MVHSGHDVRQILRAQAGDLEALDAVLRSVQEPLFRYLRGLVRDPALAEDALQEVFVKVWRKLPWLRDPELFRPWCFRIASRTGLRLAARERRRGGGDPEALTELPAPTTEDIETAETRAAVAESLADVSPASRAVLALHYLEELTLEQVAEVLGISVGTTKSRLAYGLLQLRRRLKVATWEGGMRT